MALLRLLRCHPFAKGGYDPVVKHSPHTSTSIRPRLTRTRPQRATRRYSEELENFGQNIKILNKNPAARSGCC